MKPLNLVGKNHEALHRPAERVENIDDEVYRIAGRLLATVRVRRGLAIAAPQVGISLQIVVLPNGNAVVNPEYEALSDEMIDGPESCLSLPGRHFRVPRAREAQVGATLLNGDEIDLELDGLGSRMWAHELDHLRGVLISDLYPEVRR